MRCYSCDCILNPEESVRKFKGSGQFTELCSKCLRTISEIETVEGSYAKEDEESLEEDEEDYD